MPTTLAIAKWIRNLPPRAELTLVTLLCFGPLFVMATAALARRYVPPLTNERAAAGIEYELAAAGAATAILLSRGWSWRRPRIGMLAVSALLGVFVAAGYVVVSAMAVAFAIQHAPWLVPSGDQLLRRAGSPSLLLLFFTIDAVFEEVFANAYVVRALERLDVRHAIVWSAALRVSYSVYQGALACAMIFAFGVLMAWMFRKSGRLSLPIVAHICANAAMVVR